MLWYHVVWVSVFHQQKKRLRQNILTCPSAQILDISSSQSFCSLTDKCPFVCQKFRPPEYTTTTIISLPAVEWQILSMTTRPYFCLAFGWSVLYATTALARLNWTFCLGVFNASSKSTGEREGQLFYRTAETIVCLCACVRVCLETRTAPGWKLHCRAE